MFSVQKIDLLLFFPIERSALAFCNCHKVTELSLFFFLITLQNFVTFEFALFSILSSKYMMFYYIEK